jgi:hypothetical protein
MRVISDASQVTAGVTPLALGVQYCKLTGMVKIFVGSIGALTVEPGGVKNIFVVFRKFFAFRKMSADTPPAATVLGDIPLKVIALAVAVTSVIVANETWLGSTSDHTTAYTVVGFVDLLPAGFVSVGSVLGAVYTPLLSIVPQVGSHVSVLELMV